MSFRFVSTLDTTSIHRVPPRFTGRVRVSAKDGHLDCVMWYSGGQLDDPDHRTPAFVKLRESGDIKQVRHYRQGRLHDPMLGEPAVKGFFADGAPKYRGHYRYGRRHDYGDTAAIRKWRNDGSLRAEHHYYEGMRIERVLQPVAS